MEVIFLSILFFFFLVYAGKRLEPGTEEERDYKRKQRLEERRRKLSKPLLKSLVETKMITAIKNTPGSILCVIIFFGILSLAAIIFNICNIFSLSGK